MMNVQVPIFPGFSNIAIRPGSFPESAVCILDKIDNTEHLSLELQETSFKYIPYYQNHVYILFPDNGDQMGNVFYFGSDGEMQRHLQHHIGSSQVHGRYLDVIVSREWVPHLTAPMEDIVFGYESQENVSEIRKKNYKKNTKQQKSKKITIQQKSKKITKQQSFKKSKNLRK